MSGWIPDCSAGGLELDSRWWTNLVFENNFFSFKVRQKNLSPTISVYSAIYNISGEIRRNRLNISEKLNR